MVITSPPELVSQPAGKSPAASRAKSSLYTTCPSGKNVLPVTNSFCGTAPVGNSLSEPAPPLTPPSSALPSPDAEVSFLAPLPVWVPGAFLFPDFSSKTLSSTSSVFLEDSFSTRRSTVLSTPRSAAFFTFFVICAGAVRTPATSNINTITAFIVNSVQHSKVYMLIISLLVNSRQKTRAGFNFPQRLLPGNQFSVNLAAGNDNCIFIFVSKVCDELQTTGTENKEIWTASVNTSLNLTPVTPT